MAFQVVTVRFHQIFPSQDIDVPLVDAWKFYEDRQTNREPSLDGHFKAIVRRDDGTEFETFAKSWTVWDFSSLTHRLVRIGLGANGDGGPVNPDLPNWRSMMSQHLVGRTGEQNWCAGINWATRADVYREGGKECGL